MKKTIKLLCIIAIVAITGFTLISCGDSGGGDSSSSGHTHTNGAAATCTTPQTCTDCGEIIQAALGHNYGEWSIKINANCTEAKVEKKTCSCGDEKTQKVGQPLGHDHTESLICKRLECNHQYAIGDAGPAGGIIFYVETVIPRGFTVEGYTGTIGSFESYQAYYLEAAPVNQGILIPWSNNSWDVTGATGTIVGTGKTNTAAIISAHPDDNVSNNAAKATVAYTGGDKNDWFLPSKDELSEMYNTRIHLNIPTTDSWYYWSSSQYNMMYAWDQGFVYNMKSYDSGKSALFNARAIRAF